MHRTVFIFLFTLSLIGCSDKGVEPFPPTLIIAKVHWQKQGIPNIPIVLVGTADTVRTDSSGLSIFSVLPGKYVVRAFGIHRGGPSLRSIDFDVEVERGKTATVDIVDCLPCV